MAYDGWFEYNGKEFVNLSRTSQLAEAMGINAVWPDPDDFQWMEDALGGANYDDVTQAPWYDPGFPASAEFAGLVPISVPNLDDSTLSTNVIEYIGDGGHTNGQRNETLVLVWSVVIAASTDRGADYGKRWMDRQLKGRDPSRCSGSDLRYFRHADEDAPLAHRRDVSLTRGSTVTRKRRDSCSVLWWVSFTMTAVDPYEYGEDVQVLAALGSSTPTGTVTSSGSTTLVEQSCPVFDYTPIYDPLYPALVPAPTAPNFYPDGWNIKEGMSFKRSWVRVPSLEPTTLLSVPVLTLTTNAVARMVRVAIWPSTSLPDDQCDPLWEAIVTFLPSSVVDSPPLLLVVDGEQKTSYAYDSLLPFVRRTDSLVYGRDASPLQWRAFTDPQGFMVTLDVFAKTAEEGGGYQGDDTVRASLALVPKSD